VNEKAEHVLANMEQLGAQTVRDMVLSGRWPANYHALAKEWLHQKDTEERERDDAQRDAQTFLARRSNELAHSARDEALKANKRAEEACAMAREANSIAWAASTSVERSAETARTNNKIAIAALVAALIAIAISIVSLFVRLAPML
jgi:hypothetical protein